VNTRWWKRITVWLFNQRALYTAVIDLEQQLRTTQKGKAEAESVAADRGQQLALAREDADRADALRVDALRLVDERTRVVGIYHGHIEAIHALLDLMPHAVAVEVRRHTRPEEQAQCQ
jgi:hypothetical protein